jgi:hypothetical protein
MPNLLRFHVDFRGAGAVENRQAYLKRIICAQKLVLMMQANRAQTPRAKAGVQGAERIGHGRAQWARHHREKHHTKLRTHF